MPIYIARRNIIVVQARPIYMPLFSPLQSVFINTYTYTYIIHTHVHTSYVRCAYSISCLGRWLTIRVVEGYAYYHVVFGRPISRFVTATERNDPVRDDTFLIIIVIYPSDGATVIREFVFSRVRYRIRLLFLLLFFWWVDK